MGYTLYPAQVKALEKLYKMKSAVIALTPGTGKTLAMLHLAMHLQEREHASALFCIPKSARAAFEKELVQKVGAEYLMINSDSPLKDLSKLKDARIVLIEFTVLGNYVGPLEDMVKSRPFYIFIDEAHALCSPKSAQTTYMRELRQHCIGCFSVTGSPFMTSIEGLFHLYSFTFPKVRLFQSWFRFRSMYCVTQDRTVRMLGKKRIIKDIVGYKNMGELNAILDRITVKGSVEYSVDYRFLKAPLDEERLEEYQLAARGLLVTEEEKEWGPRLHDLQRVVDGLPQNGEPVCEYNKTRLLLDTVREIMERDEAVLVYVEYMDTIDYLKEIFGRHEGELGYRSLMVISGAEKESKRQEIEQSLGKRDILIITKAGQQSRNLQRANNIVLYNIPYSLGQLLQTIGRICRTDTEYSQQHIYFLEIERTIDTYRTALFKDRLSLLDQLLGKECRGTLTCDYIEIDRMKMKELKNSLLWRMR